MEKIKNFIYDKSDLFVALLIVAIAALVIWFGINNIMRPISDDTSAQAKSQVTEETTSDSAVTNSGVETDQSAEANSTEPKKEETTGTTKEAKIIISAGETTEQVAEKLLVSEAITNKADFLSTLKSMGLETKVNQGTFTIPAGSTNEQICKIITKT